MQRGKRHSMESAQPTQGFGLWLRLLMEGELSLSERALRHQIEQLHTAAAASHVINTLQVLACGELDDVVERALWVLTPLAERADASEISNVIVEVCAFLSQVEDHNSGLLSLCSEASKHSDSASTPQNEPPSSEKY